MLHFVDLNCIISIKNTKMLLTCMFPGWIIDEDRTVDGALYMAGALIVLSGFVMMPIGCLQVLHFP